jgi:hypothetical protein
MKKRELNTPHSSITTHINSELAGNFVLDVQDFFSCRIDRLDVAKISRNAATAEGNIKRNFNRLSNILSDDERSHLIELDSAYNTFELYSRDLAYKNGFSDGIRFIMQNLTSAGV